MDVALQEQFRAKIRQALDAKGWSQSDLARAMGITPQAVGDYFHGRTCPSLNVVERFAEALAVEPANMLDKRPLKILQVST